MKTAPNTGFASGGVPFELEVLCSETRPNAKPENVSGNLTDLRMDKKDIILLEKLYSELDQKSIEQVKQRFAERNATVQEIFNREIIPPHLKDLDKDTAVLRILSPSDIHNVLSIGIYNSFKNADFSILNDSLFSYNRLHYYRDTLLESGYDHCRYFLNILESFAGNDISHIKKIYSENLGLAKNGNKFLVTGSNLIISLLNKNANWETESLEKANNFLLKKNSKFEIATIQYLISIIQRDSAKATEYLNELCELYKKATWLHEFHNPFLKVIGIYTHGLYSLAFHFLPPEIFGKMVQPIHTTFWTEFAEFNKANNFKTGNSLITFDNEMKGLNKIYE